MCLRGVPASAKLTLTPSAIPGPPSPQLGFHVVKLRLAVKQRNVRVGWAPKRERLGACSPSNPAVAVVVCVCDPLPFRLFSYFTSEQFASRK